MTDFTISSDSAQRQVLRSSDRLTIASDATLHPSGTAIAWDFAGPAGQVRINVTGAINAYDGVAIDAVGNATEAQDIVVITEGGSSIRAQGDVLHIGSPMSGGSIGMENMGLLKSYDGSVVDALISGTPPNSGLSPLYLLNYASGVMLSNAAATIHLTSSTAVPRFDGYAIIQNLGTIISTGKGVDAAPAIDTADLNASAIPQVRIINSEGGVIQSVDSDAIRPGQYTEITNIAGTIVAGGGAANHGIDVGDEVGITIRNDAGAEIRGAGSGIGGQAAVSIENSGEILGRIGAGIELDTASTSITTIVNHVGGQIRSYGTGSGIDVSGLVDLTNDGAIRVSALHVGGVAIGGGEIANTGSIWAFNKTVSITDQQGRLNLTNSGSITVDPSLLYQTDSAAIEIVGNFDDVITNTGTILGSVRAGGGNDRIDTTAGYITGTIFGEGGDDTINVGTKNVRIEGGDGNDILSGGGNIFGGAGDDHLIGLNSFGPTSFDGYIYGGDGNDLIETNGRHAVDGGAGYDTYLFDAHDRQSGIVTGTGAGPTIEASIIIGTAFDDIIRGDYFVSDDKVYGGDGNDDLAAGQGINLLGSGPIDPSGII